MIIQTSEKNLLMRIANGFRASRGLRKNLDGEALVELAQETIESKPEQEKVVEVTENGTIEVVPDEGLTLSKVTATIDVKGAGSNKLTQIADRSITELTAEDLEGVTHINEYAFYKSYKLRTVTLPESLQSVGGSAFEYCYNLAEVINNSPIDIKKYGDGSYGYLTAYVLALHKGDSKIIKTNDLATLVADNGQNYCLGYDGTDTKITIPENCNVNQYAFYKNINLKEAIISDGANSIGKYAFWLCHYITKITLPSSLTNIGEMAFTACHCLEELRIPEGVTTLNRITMQGTGYASKTGEFNLYLPSTITSVVGPMFYQAANIGGPSWLPSDWHDPDSIHGNVNVHFASQQAFDAWLSRVYVTSGDNIGAPSNLKYYLNGERIKNMASPSTYTTLRANVYPKGLEVDVVCGGNITRVDNGSCRGVKNISFVNNTQIPSLSSSDAFNTDTLEQIRVPASLYDKWIAATNWSKLADYIVPIEEVSE